jgi:hypothetical protein
MWNDKDEEGNSKWLLPNGKPFVFIWTPPESVICPNCGKEAFFDGDTFICYDCLF